MEMEFTGLLFNHNKKWLKSNNLLLRALIILLAYQINNNQFKMTKDLTFLVKVLAQYKDNNLETTSLCIINNSRTHLMEAGI